MSDNRATLNGFSATSGNRSSKQPDTSHSQKTNQSTTPDAAETISQNTAGIAHGRAENYYEDWPTPTVIISDGAYGLDQFNSDPQSPTELTDWYEPHVKKWSKHAGPRTTLLLWNTEEGWAHVHKLLVNHGWELQGVNHWNKGKQHVAGNTNTQTLRHFPKVTETCAHYVRNTEATLGLSDTEQSVQQWLRSEWERTGLPLEEANTACNVADAATRKYLTEGTDWYFPPVERFEQLREYANEHGDPNGAPYFEPKQSPANADTLATMGSTVVHQAIFDCPVGVTNVWNHPPVDSDERITNNGTAVHPNQKPLKLMHRLVRAASTEGDSLWEPFGGLCTASLAGKQLNRSVYAAEPVKKYHDIATTRLDNTDFGEELQPDPQQSLTEFK